MVKEVILLENHSKKLAELADEYFQIKDEWDAISKKMKSIQKEYLKLGAAIPDDENFRFQEGIINLDFSKVPETMVLNDKEGLVKVLKSLQKHDDVRLASYKYTECVELLGETVVDSFFGKVNKGSRRAYITKNGK